MRTCKRFCPHALAVLGLAVPVLAVSLSASAQESIGTQTANDSPPLRLQIESKLVVIRVVVRDAQGRPVNGLKKEDFKVFDQGKEQSIAQFDAEMPSESAAQTSGAGAPQMAAPRASAAERYIALYFDNLDSSSGDLIAARDAADRLFGSKLQAGEHIAVLTSDEMLSDFTDDPRKIHDALFRLHASVHAPAQVHECPDLTIPQAMEIAQSTDLDGDAWRAAWAESKTCAIRTFSSSQDQNSSRPDPASVSAIRALAQRILERSRQTALANLEAIHQVVQTISTAPGERSLVVVSPGFVAQEEERALDRVVDRALRSGVVVNAIAPQGLAALVPQADPSQESIQDSRARAARDRLTSEQEFDNGAVLAELADGTGGAFFHHRNDLGAGLDDVAGHSPSYTLAFDPRDLKLDGKFHALKVSLVNGQRGYRVEARRGYFAMANETGTSEVAASPLSAGAATASPAPNVAAKTSAIRTEPPPLRPSAKSGRETRLITVAQLAETIKAARGGVDGEFAKQLTGLQLTERLSSARRAALESALPGDLSRKAFIGLADASTFLPLPAAELPSQPAPDLASQINWLKMAVGYVQKTLSTLPNLFAEREVTLFADVPPKETGQVFMPYQPLHAMGSTVATVLYRDGEEVLDKDSAKDPDHSSTSMGLITTGEFGPLLNIALQDAARSSLTWSHWEHWNGGAAAVYRYAVPKAKSHYQLTFCCVPNGTGLTLYQEVSAYHGEITVDPAHGTILRLTLQADPENGSPMARADMMVEYGPVEIGGQTYYCPVKSISIAKATIDSWHDDFGVQRMMDWAGAGNPHWSGGVTQARNSGFAPQQTLLDDVAFDKYHVFRAESRIVPNQNPAPREP